MVQVLDRKSELISYLITGDEINTHSFISRDGFFFI